MQSGAIHPGRVPNEFSQYPAVYTTPDIQTAVGRASVLFGHDYISIVVFAIKLDGLKVYTFTTREIWQKFIYKNFKDEDDEDGDLFLGESNLAFADVRSGAVCRNPRSPLPELITEDTGTQFAYISKKGIAQLNTMLDDKNSS